MLDLFVRITSLGPGTSGNSRCHECSDLVENKDDGKKATRDETKIDEAKIDDNIVVMSRIPGIDLDASEKKWEDKFKLEHFNIETIQYGCSGSKTGYGRGISLIPNKYQGLFLPSQPPQETVFFQRSKIAKEKNARKNKKLARENYQRMKKEKRELKTLKQEINKNIAAPRKDSKRSTIEDISLEGSLESNKDTSSLIADSDVEIATKLNKNAGHVIFNQAESIGLLKPAKIKLPKSWVPLLAVQLMSHRFRYSGLVQLQRKARAKARARARAINRTSKLNYPNLKKIAFNCTCRIEVDSEEQRKHQEGEKFAALQKVNNLEMKSQIKKEGTHNTNNQLKKLHKNIQKEEKYMSQQQQEPKKQFHTHKNNVGCKNGSKGRRHSCEEKIKEKVRVKRGGWPASPGGGLKGGAGAGVGSSNVSTLPTIGRVCLCSLYCLMLIQPLDSIFWKKSHIVNALIR